MVEIGNFQSQPFIAIAPSALPRSVKKKNTFFINLDGVAINK